MSDLSVYNMSCIIQKKVRLQYVRNKLDLKQLKENKSLIED